MEAGRIENVYIKKNRESHLESRTAGRSGNQGFTLIELLIGISILSVVGVMTMMLTGTASRMYRSTIRISQIQTESQTVSRRLSRAVMDAASIYLDESGEGTILFTGDITKEDDSFVYFGEMFWWDKDSGCLYQGSHVSIRVSKADGEENGEDEAGGGEEGLPAGALTCSAAKAFFLGGTGSGREYLISDKLREMSLEIYPTLEEEDKAIEGSYYYTADGAVTVNYALTFSHLDSGDYKTESSASTRNIVKYLWERKDGDDS